MHAYGSILVRGTLALFALAIVFVVASHAEAQVAQPYGLPLEQLTPVEERVGDVGPLSVSLRQVQPGLAVPTGFSQVYRVPGHANLLMRIDGGVTAVFPESVYDPNGRASVPPGTMFYIGLPQADSLSQYADALQRQQSGLAPLARPEEPVERVYDMAEPLPPGSVSGEATFAVRTPPVLPSAAFSSQRIEPMKPNVSTRLDAVEGPAIVVDHAYRVERVRELLERAAEARRGSRGT